MTTSNLPSKYTVEVEYGDIGSGLPTRLTDTLQSIKKPIYYSRFNPYMPDDAIGISYAGYTPLDPKENIRITDLSGEVFENIIQLTKEKTTEYGKSFLLPSKNFLITDITTDPNITSQPVKPLFYVHKVPADADFASIKVLNDKYELVSSSLYRKEIVYKRDSNGNELSEIDYIALYNDFTNEVSGDGSYKLYFVQYKRSNNIETVLLSNHNIYREATFGDVDSLGRLHSWVKAYIIKELNNYYEVTLPSETTYYFRFTESVRIELLPPAATSIEQPWFVRISNGAFKHTYNNNVYTYKINEFRNQSFNPVEPYKLAVEDKAESVFDGILKLSRENIAADVLPLDIVIRDQNGKVLKALTTNSYKVGQSYEGVAWSDKEILSYDLTNGLVHVDVLLKDYYDIRASYYYVEDTFEITDVNFNPVQNSSVKGYTYVFYIIPNTGVQVPEFSVQYIKVDRYGAIIDSSQTGLTVTTLKDFISTYTEQHPYYLLVGSAFLTRSIDTDSVSFIDIRHRGGGIKEEEVEGAIRRNPEAMWYTDIGFGGGIPYPGKCSILVKLPCVLLNEYGGKFNKEEIFNIVKKHMPFGHYPVLDFYGITPDVSIQSVNSDGFALYWPSEGSDVTYDVYLGQGNNFSKHNASPIVDDPNGNTYTVDGLTLGAVYKVYVVATANYPCGTAITMAKDGLPIGLESPDDSLTWIRGQGPRSKMLTILISDTGLT